MKRLRALSCLLALAAVAGGCAPQPPPRPVVVRLQQPTPAPFDEPYTPPPTYVPWGQHSIATRIAQIGPRARSRWRTYFQQAGVAYPPRAVVLLGLKRERVVHVYAGPSTQRLSMLRTIDVTAASGSPGPKIREGDKQVPEGVYRVDKLNPNSNFHVSLRLDYPNGRDLAMAGRDGRRRLGGNIMIHGGEESIGCLAVGDQAAEDLFVLAADAGIGQVTVVIAPRDFRSTGDRSLLPGQPPWVEELYADLDLKLRTLPPPVVVRVAPTALAAREPLPRAVRGAAKHDYRAESFARNAEELARRARELGQEPPVPEALGVQQQPWGHDSAPVAAQELPWGSDPSAR